MLRKEDPWSGFGPGTQGQGPGPLDPQKTGHGRPSSRTLVLKSDCNGGVFSATDQNTIGPASF